MPSKFAYHHYQIDRPSEPVLDAGATKRRPAPYYPMSSLSLLYGVSLMMQDAQRSIEMIQRTSDLAVQAAMQSITEIDRAQSQLMSLVGPYRN